MNDLSQQLLQGLAGRVCLLGVGNVDRGDDGFGVRLAEALGKRCEHDIEIVVAGQTPERCLSRLAEAGFDHVVFLDAVEFGGTAGSVVFLNSAEMAARFPQVSTHKLSLGLLARLIEAGGRTRAWLLGVQPGSLAQGTGLTTPVQRSLALLADLLVESLFEDSEAPC